MDNPQHYQPLSHALNPPPGPHQATYTGMFNSKITNPSTTTITNTTTHREEEEEEEEEDGDDEGIVEEQLSRQEPDTHSSPSSPRAKIIATSADAQVQQVQHEDPNSQERKRRPGRPRGSKNRKPRASGQTVSKQEPVFYSAPAAIAPPQHPDVNAQNHQYYEFQWRVLNLCSEFYTAAEELVKATQPLVIAQCYQMGPGSKVDPLVMLNEAKRICDTLLSNPSQLITSPPPPIFTAAPTLYQPMTTQPSTSTARPAASSTKSGTSAAAPVTTPAFVVTMPASQPTYPQYQMYAPPGQYPTTPYYQYPYVATGSYYPPPQPHPQVSPPAQAQAQSASAPSQPVQTPQPEASTSTSISVNAATVITSSSAGGNQGAWSEEETERLKKLAEESRSTTHTGEIDWDRVVAQWGTGRTRHQILIKATSLGLKESSSRGVKRRRENDGTSDAASPSIPPTPTVTNSGTTAAPNATAASPSHSQTASTPAASPALKNQQRPPPKTASGLPWPMPTVAVNTPSPVIATATGAPASTTTTQAQDQQRTSYYRARPNQDAVKPAAPSAVAAHAHPYMYQPNGSSGSSRLGKENGK